MSMHLVRWVLDNTPLLTRNTCSCHLMRPRFMCFIFKCRWREWQSDDFWQVTFADFWHIVCSMTPYCGDPVGDAGGFNLESKHCAQSDSFSELNWVGGQVWVVGLLILKMHWVIFHFLIYFLNQGLNVHSFQTVLWCVAVHIKCLSIKWPTSVISNRHKDQLISDSWSL